MKRSLIVAFASVLLMSGCTVGRYVTNVTPNGPGKISVEKCVAKAYGNFYWNDNCATETINVPTPASSK
jgi:hypothetical protein